MCKLQSTGFGVSVLIKADRNKRASNRSIDEEKLSIILIQAGQSSSGTWQDIPWHKFFQHDKFQELLKGRLITKLVKGISLLNGQILTKEVL
jgi:hypothetical protein